MTAIYIACVMLNLFVLTSGLIFIQNSRIIAPLMVALAIQIPVFSCSHVMYEFGDGLYAFVGLSTAGAYKISLFAVLRIGCEMHFYILSDSLWGVGVNVVPVLLLVAMRLAKRPPWVKYIVAQIRDTTA